MFQKLRTLTAVFVLACSPLALAGNSFADPLFKSAGKSVAAKLKTDATVARQQLVTVNGGLLWRLRAAGKATAPALSTLDVELFDGRLATLALTGSSRNPDGTMVWTATAGSDGYAALSIAGDKVVGVIESGGKTYMIDPAEDGSHVLREIKPSSFKRDKHIKRPAVSGLLPTVTSQALAEARSTQTFVDLLAAYTSDAEAHLTAGGATMAQVVDRDIAIVNRGMTSSGIPITIRRAGLKAVSSTYNENTADVVKPLYDLTSGTNANFASIRNERNFVSADLVTLYVLQRPQNYCGVAWVNVPTPVSQYGFAVVDAACAGSVALAHELGHAMGLNHDRYVSSNATQANNYGFVSVTGNFRDIMSYPNKCYDRLNRDCALKVYYSSPNKIINGRRAGRSSDKPNPANATRWLKRKRDIISGFR